MPKAGDEMTDPVCGMTVEPGRSLGPVVHDGQEYYFCSPTCQQRFAADPLKYLHGSRDAHGQQLTVAHHADVPKASRYTCPMHPEVVSDRPGPCPKCGMALELEVAEATDRPDPEYLDFRRRLIVGSLFGMPVVALAMLDMLPGQPLHRVLSMRTNLLIQLVLSVPVVLWAGWPLFVRAAQSLRNLSPNMFTLIGLGVGAAFVYSVAATLTPEWFPTKPGTHGVEAYFETAVAVTLLEIGRAHV